jgi:hypothetical protein
MTDRPNAPTRGRLTRSLLVWANAAGLLIAVAGMIVQIANHVKYPTVPPGVVILAATAILIVTVPWPPIRILGAIAPGFILVGGMVSSTGRINISHPGQVGKFVGTVVQFGGLAIAVIAGVLALIEWRRPQRQDAATRPPRTAPASGQP